LQPLDTIRLEIVYTNHHEWYGSPGDRSLSQSNPAALVGSGTIGNGFFAITVNNLFISDEAILTFQGKQKLGARAAYQYDFRLPRATRGLSVSLFGGSGTVGEEGTFWVDAQSLDLIRVNARAEEIPPFLPLREITIDVRYERTRIGAHSSLLAQRGDLFLLKTTGEESYNHLEYTHCHQFSAESSVRFEENARDSGPSAGFSSGDGAAASAATVNNGAVTPFLPVILRLTTPVTDESAVGTLIEARVIGNVAQKGKVILPDGAAVHGRIRRLEQYHNTYKKGSADFIVGLEFTEAVTNGGTLRFYANLEKMDKLPGIRVSLTELILMETDPTYGYRTLTVPELPGVASFFIQGKTFTIPSGFRTYWMTRGLMR
jgi:hypothetical protein